ncbi:protein kinase [Streptomyces sp. NBC_00154]|uniref:serine/threonine-protein kinase n=1 Tax=Streptomyces sp. NBC_00154 TaxID=2975670 RepID=UPI00224DCE3B|nr:serine/threonine-protein kinase [Streptomyces sp. NBC_00154]MCX5316159.1 serine/threonine-protein kinase [Streptomyces sp. NBC_00154]
MSLRDDDPTEVGGYKLEGRLGAGGMGVVYLARSPRGTPVALKVVRPEWAEDKAFRARFELEVAAARMVHSRYTAPVVDASPRGPEPWMATLYVPGQNLHTQVSQNGPLGEAELTQLAAALAQALADIHRAGVIHRDLKPSNVLLTEDGPRVIDFGIAQATDGLGLTETSHIVGTPAFMAPEQLQASRTVGPEADIFGLGCVLTFAATGYGPFKAHGAFGAAYQIVHEEPDLTDVPDGLRQLVADCLRKQPASRPTPAAIRRQLTAPPAPPPAPVRRGMPARRRWAVLKQAVTRRVPAWVAASAAVAAVPLTLVAVGTGNEHRPSSPKPEPPHIVLENAQPWVSNVRVPAAPGEQCVNGDPASEIRAFLYCLAGSRVLSVEIYHGKTVWEQVRPDADDEKQATLVGVRGKELFYTTSTGDQQWLRALDVRTGRILRTRKFAQPSQIVLSHGSFLLISSDRIEGLDATAQKTFWQRPLTGETSVATLGDRTYLIVRGQHRTEVTALNPSTGSVQTPVVLEGKLHLLASANGFVALGNRSAGDADSTFLLVLDTATNTASRIPLRGQKFRLTLSRDTALLAYENGHISAINTRTGKERWSASVQGAVIADPVYTDRKFLVMTDEGNVSAFSADGGTLVGLYPLSDSAPEKTPSDRPEIIRNNDEFYALTPDGLLYTVRSY